MPMKHGLSFDVECYRQIHWRHFLGEDPNPSRFAERATHDILDVLATHRARATFFVVGSMARAFPGVVARIASEGHEIGSHGDEHRDVRRLTMPEFQRELAHSKATLEDLTGKPIVGHRAPMFSMTGEMDSAFEALALQGFTYDSSLFPFSGARYGDPQASSSISRLRSGVFEVPLSVVEINRRRLPALGGGYFRVAPYAYSDWAMRRRIKAGVPAITYFHPWEFSSEPILPGIDEVLTHPMKALSLAWYTLRRLPGRGRSMKTKLDHLLRSYSFAPLREILEASDAWRAADRRSDAVSVIGRIQSGLAA